jgi:AraC-like DNA-binding protein
MPPKSELLTPPRSLAGCFFSAIVRDTRGAELNDSDRLNHFPGSPLITITYVAEGEIRLVPPGGGIEHARAAQPLPRISVTPPQSAPTLSWCPGPVFAVSVGVYPDAWRRLSRTFDLSGVLESSYLAAGDMRAFWRHFCNAMAPRWRKARGLAVFPEWSGVARVSDWSRAFIARATIAGRGRSARALEQRIRRWTGQTQQSLAFYAAFEDLHQVSIRSRGMPLADIALEAGYSDQSHMGRAVRRATGFSPAKLNRLIDTEEAFWCYRLLGERF